MASPNAGVRRSSDVSRGSRDVPEIHLLPMEEPPALEVPAVGALDARMPNASGASDSGSEREAESAELEALASPREAFASDSGDVASSQPSSLLPTELLADGRGPVGAHASVLSSHGGSVALSAEESESYHESSDATHIPDVTTLTLFPPSTDDKTQPRSLRYTRSCPDGHNLSSYWITDNEQSIYCDTCGTFGFPENTEMYGCRSCNWDVCDSCHAALPVGDLTMGDTLEDVRTNDEAGKTLLRKEGATSGRFTVVSSVAVASVVWIQALLQLVQTMLAFAVMPVELPRGWVDFGACLAWSNLWIGVDGSDGEDALLGLKRLPIAPNRLLWNNVVTLCIVAASTVVLLVIIVLMAKCDKRVLVALSGAFQLACFVYWMSVPGLVTSALHHVVVLLDASMAVQPDDVALLVFVAVLTISVFVMIALAVLDYPGAVEVFRVTTTLPFTQEQALFGVLVILKRLALAAVLGVFQRHFSWLPWLFIVFSEMLCVLLTVIHRPYTTQALNVLSICGSLCSVLVALLLLPWMLGTSSDMGRAAENAMAWLSIAIALFGFAFFVALALITLYHNSCDAWKEASERDFDALQWSPRTFFASLKRGQDFDSADGLPVGSQDYDSLITNPDAPPGRTAALAKKNHTGLVEEAWTLIDEAKTTLSLIEKLRGEKSTSEIDRVALTAVAADLKQAVMQLQRSAAIYEGDPRNRADEKKARVVDCIRATDKTKTDAMRVATYVIYKQRYSDKLPQALVIANRESETALHSVAMSSSAQKAVWDDGVVGAAAARETLTLFTEMIESCADDNAAGIGLHACSMLEASLEEFERAKDEYAKQKKITTWRKTTRDQAKGAGRSLEAARRDAFMAACTVSNASPSLNLHQANKDLERVCAKLMQAVLQKTVRPGVHSPLLLTAQSCTRAYLTFDMRLREADDQCAPQVAEHLRFSTAECTAAATVYETSAEAYAQGRDPAAGALLAATERLSGVRAYAYPVAVRARILSSVSLLKDARTNVVVSTACLEHTGVYAKDSHSNEHDNLRVTLNDLRDKVVEDLKVFDSLLKDRVDASPSMTLQHTAHAVAQAHSQLMVADAIGSSFDAYPRAARQAADAIEECFVCSKGEHRVPTTRTIADAWKGLRQSRETMQHELQGEFMKAAADTSIPYIMADLRLSLKDLHGAVTNEHVLAFTHTFEETTSLLTTSYLGALEKHSQRHSLGSASDVVKALMDLSDCVKKSRGMLTIAEQHAAITECCRQCVTLASDLDDVCADDSPDSAGMLLNLLDGADVVPAVLNVKRLVNGYSERMLLSGAARSLHESIQATLNAIVTHSAVPARAQREDVVASAQALSRALRIFDAYLSKLSNFTNDSLELTEALTIVGDYLGPSIEILTMADERGAMETSQSYLPDEGNFSLSTKSVRIAKQPVSRDALRASVACLLEMAVELDYLLERANHEYGNDLTILQARQAELLNARAHLDAAVDGFEGEQGDGGIHAVAVAGRSLESIQQYTLVIIARHVATQRLLESTEAVARLAETQAFVHRRKLLETLQPLSSSVVMLLDDVNSNPDQVRLSSKRVHQHLNDTKAASRVTGRAEMDPAVGRIPVARTNEIASVAEALTEDAEGVAVVRVKSEHASIQAEAALDAGVLALASQFDEICEEFQCAMMASRASGDSSVDKKHRDSLFALVPADFTTITTEKELREAAARLYVIVMSLDEVLCALREQAKNLDDGLCYNIIKTRKVLQEGHARASDAEGALKDGAVASSHTFRALTRACNHLLRDSMRAQVLVELYSAQVSMLKAAGEIDTAIVKGSLAQNHVTLFETVNEAVRAIEKLVVKGTQPVPKEHEIQVAASNEQLALSAVELASSTLGRTSDKGAALKESIDELIAAGRVLPDVLEEPAPVGLPQLGVLAAQVAIVSARLSAILKLSGTEWQVGDVGNEDFLQPKLREEHKLLRSNVGKTLGFHQSRLRQDAVVANAIACAEKMVETLSAIALRVYEAPLQLEVQKARDKVAISTGDLREAFAAAKSAQVGNKDKAHRELLHAAGALDRAQRKAFKISLRPSSVCDLQTATNVSLNASATLTHAKERSGTTERQHLLTAAGEMSLALSVVTKCASSSYERVKEASRKVLVRADQFEKQYHALRDVVEQDRWRQRITAASVDLLASTKKILGATEVAVVNASNSKLAVAVDDAVLAYIVGLRLLLEDENSVLFGPSNNMTMEGLVMQTLGEHTVPFDIISVETARLALEILARFRSTLEMLKEENVNAVVDRQIHNNLRTISDTELAIERAIKACGEHPGTTETREQLSIANFAFQMAWEQSVQMIMKAEAMVELLRATTVMESAAADSPTKPIRSLYNAFARIGIWGSSVVQHIPQDVAELTPHLARAPGVSATTKAAVQDRIDVDEQEVVSQVTAEVVAKAEALADTCQDCLEGEVNGDSVAILNRNARALARVLIEATALNSVDANTEGSKFHMDKLVVEDAEEVDEGGWPLDLQRALIKASLHADDWDRQLVDDINMGDRKNLAATIRALLAATRQLDAVLRRMQETTPSSEIRDRIKFARKELWSAAMALDEAVTFFNARPNDPVALSQLRLRHEEYNLARAKAIAATGLRHSYLMDAPKPWWTEPGGRGRSRKSSLVNFNDKWDMPEILDNVKLYENILTEVTPELFLAGAGVARNLALLRSKGITHILNVAGAVVSVPYPPYFVSKRISLHDSPGEDIASLMYLVVEFIEDALEEGGKVLVHCVPGTSRSAACIIGYLMWKEDLSYAQVARYLRFQRAVAVPNSGFKEQLIAWMDRFVNPLGYGDSPRLYSVTQHNPNDQMIITPKLIEFTMIPATRRSQSVLVLHTHQCVYVWMGSEARPVLRMTASHFVRQLQYYEKATAMVLRVNEGAEPPAFWNAISERGDFATSPFQRSASFTVINANAPVGGVEDTPQQPPRRMIDKAKRAGWDSSPK